MFRPERVISTSVICLRKDLDAVLEALNGFGEFHIEYAVEGSLQAEYSQSIQEAEETYSDTKYLIKQLSVEKANLLDIFRGESEVEKVQVTAANWKEIEEYVRSEVSTLKDNTQRLLESLSAVEEEITQQTHLKVMLEIMSALKVDLSDIETLRLTYVFVAGVPRKNVPALLMAIRDFPLIFHRCYLTKKTDFVCIAVLAKNKEDIEKALKDNRGEILQIPENLPKKASEALEKVMKQIAHVKEKKYEIQKAIATLGEKNAFKLSSLKETAQGIVTLLLAKHKTLQSQHLATVKGFVPKKKLTGLREKVDRDLNGNVLVLEGDASTEADPPTLMRNRRFVRPFEEITRLYGVPHYEELDPTPFIAVTFPLVFGLMFGDFGHGLVLLAGGLAGGFLIKRESTLKNICWILASCGIGAILAGLLFGEFFGLRLFSPLWFSPFDNVLTFLVFSLFIGVVQIVSGLVLEMINFLVNHNLLDAVVTSIPKILFYAGSVYLIAAYQLDFAAWMQGPILLALIPFAILVVGKPLALSRIVRARETTDTAKETGSFAERLFESGDLVTRLLSNTVSYSRILALLMAHWALIMVTYVIAGLVNSGSPLSIILSAFIVVFGNVFVLALEGLVVFIHTLRLHFYEWFSKFYQGTGTKFSPYKQTFVYTEIVVGKSGSRN